MGDNPLLLLQLLNIYMQYMKGSCLCFTVYLGNDSRNELFSISTYGTSIVFQYAIYFKYYFLYFNEVGRTIRHP